MAIGARLRSNLGQSGIAKSEAARRSPIGWVGWLVGWVGGWLVGWLVAGTWSYIVGLARAREDADTRQHFSEESSTVFLCYLLIHGLALSYLALRKLFGLRVQGCLQQENDSCLVGYVILIEDSFTCPLQWMPYILLLGEQGKLLNVFTMAFRMWLALLQFL